MKDIQLLVITAAVVVAIAVIAKQLRPGRYPTGPLPYYSRQFLLSKGETAFFHALRAAIPPEVVIAAKVRVSDIIACKAADWKQGYGGRISQKHVDFVLVEGRSTKFLLVIELDDKSHRQRDRRDRDDFLDRAFKAAGIEVLHVPAAAKYDVIRLRQSIVERLRAVS